MNPDIYGLFSRACPFILLWLVGFAALTVGAIVRRGVRRELPHGRESMIGGELPGLPLVLMHSACFGYSLYCADWVSALVFGWWGPGFLVVATLVVCKRPVAWERIARATSVACKINYLVLVGLFFHHGFMAPVFAYSLWIMHDQVRLAWLQGNADRTRRVFEDRWIPRVCYPLFLGLPFIDSSMPYRWIVAGAAVVVFVLWIWGLARLVRRGTFRDKPASFTDNLRDIVYLERPAAGE